MYNKYKWEEWSKEGYSVPMPDFPGPKTDPMNCLKTLVYLYAEGQQLVPIQEEGSHISSSGKTLFGASSIIAEPPEEKNG